MGKDMGRGGREPTVFISYSWENESHKNWVRAVATRLRQEGIDVRLDQWDLAPGDQLTAYMESAVRENDYVLVVCTPHYKARSDQREGGVGYEGDIMTAEVHYQRNHRKFIPLLRNGSWDAASPTWLSGKCYLDFSGNPYSEDQYTELKITVAGKREGPPPLGRPKLKANKKISVGGKVAGSKSNPEIVSSDEIRIIGIIADEVTTPCMDGSRGSALYSIPFRLSSLPPSGWVDIFIKTWNRPPQWTSMHRPGIARVVGDKIVLTGTTVDEVEKYHRETLILSVERSNELYAEDVEKERRQREREQAQTEKHERDVRNVADRIKFDCL